MRYVFMGGAGVFAGSILTILTTSLVAALCGGVLVLAGVLVRREAHPLPTPVVLGKLRATAATTELVSSLQTGLIQSAAVKAGVITQLGMRLDSRLRSEQVNPVLIQQLATLLERELAALSALATEANSALGQVAAADRAPGSLLDRLLDWCGIHIIEN